MARTHPFATAADSGTGPIENGSGAPALDAGAVRKARRGELAAFLKSRRARISPEEVGLPVGARRRTPGLRREEVAQLAGVGVTWYTWLEQGRPINVSVQVLDAISRTLGLDGVECAHRNVMRKVFLTSDCCNPYAGQPVHLARMVGFLRAAYAKNLHDPHWVAFIDELISASPLFATMWARNDVASPVSRIKVIRNVVTGDLQMVMTSMSMPSIAGAWLQVLTPADDHAWTVLRELLDMTDEQREAPWQEHFEEHRRMATA